MKSKVIEGNNRIIAEFMGGVYCQIDDNSDWFYKFNQGNNPNPHANIGTYKRVKDLDYHIRWEWLMPVWAKVKFVLEHINKIAAKDLIGKIKGAIGNVEIKQAYGYICKAVEYVNWYNTQKQQHGK
jgi:hypothetical protein